MAKSPCDFVCIFPLVICFFFVCFFFLFFFNALVDVDSVHSDESVGVGGRRGRRGKGDSGIGSSIVMTPTPWHGAKWLYQNRGTALHGPHLRSALCPAAVVGASQLPASFRFGNNGNVLLSMYACVFPCLVCARGLRGFGGREWAVPLCCFGAGGGVSAKCMPGCDTGDEGCQCCGSQVGEKHGRSRRGRRH